MNLVDITGPVRLKLIYPGMHATCPLTQIQDTYDVRLKLISKGKKSIELKSLAGYLKKFHGVKILCENLAYLIMVDLSDLGIFSRVKVTLYQYSSEEVVLTATATYQE